MSLDLEEFIKLPPPEVSFEFFPPKTPAMEKTLWDTVKKLEPLNPKFVSVTYGAGGSTRDSTRQTIQKIYDGTKLTPAAHLTCVGSSKSDIDEIAQEYWDSGIKHIVALRGDPPEGSGKYSPHPSGYPYCSNLVKGLKNIGDFEISVAAFPDIHPEAESSEADIDYLKQKADAGATRAITQYFFGTDVYLSFRDKAVAAGVNIPIVPGIILFHNFNQLVNFSNRCDMIVPKWMYNLLEGLDEHPERRDIITGMIIAEQCRILREEGVEHFHFYTLNQSTQALAVCRVLGIK